MRVYATGDSPQAAVDAAAKAAAEGVAMVVGPITRESVGAVARSSVKVPTLALNAPDSSGSLPPQLVFLSVSVENEARLVAQLAHGEGRRKMFVIAGDSAILRRVRSAFADEWGKLGETLAGEAQFTKDPKALAAMRADLKAKGVDGVFMALDVQAARTVRPYLAAAVAYGTSQLYRGSGRSSINLDLKGVHFVDMPWLLQPESPSLQSYPRSKRPLAVELERLYALGIDAWRVAAQFVQHGMQRGDSVQGATGTLIYDGGNQFLRQLPEAIFGDGGVVNVGPPQ